MIRWNNMDTLLAFKELVNTPKVNLSEAMSGPEGAQRVKNYTIPMGEGLDFNYGARPVDDGILAVLGKLAEEAQLAEKYQLEKEFTFEVTLRPIARGDLPEDIAAMQYNKEPVEQFEQLSL